jgi:putative FmdB family regulatory protein
MPLYEYSCRDCGHRFEILQRLGEGAEGLACPSCSAATLDKQFSTFAAGAGSRGDGGGESEAGYGAADCGAGACCGGGACGMGDFGDLN